MLEREYQGLETNPGWEKGPYRDQFHRRNNSGTREYMVSISKGGSCCGKEVAVNTQLKLTNISGIDRVMMVNEHAFKDGTVEYTIGQLSLTDDGTFMKDVMYDIAGRKRVGNGGWRALNYGGRTDFNGILKISELPDEIDVEATAKGLIQQAMDGNFENPVLMPPAPGSATKP